MILPLRILSAISKLVSRTHAHARNCEITQILRKRRYCPFNKEELKMVVRDILACAQPNCHKTFTALWNPYRRVSSRGQRAQIRYSRGVRGEKTENDRPPFWFYGESIRSSVFNKPQQYPTPTKLVGTVVIMVRIAVEARRRRLPLLV